jgi:hypothetical protein
MAMGNFTFKIYNAMTIIVCDLRDLVLHALEYYINLNISWQSVCLLSCVRVVAISLGSGVVSPMQKPEDGCNAWPKHVAK